MTGRAGCRRRCAPFALVVFVVFVVGACGSGGDTTTTVTSTVTSIVTSTVPSTMPSTTAPSTAPSTVPTTAPSTVTSIAAPSGLDADDRAAITVVFETFFGGAASTVDDKVAVLQGGETYRSMLTDASANEQFQQMSTDIREIRAGTAAECAAKDAGSGCAIVVHDVLVAGFPMAAAIESPAVRDGDAWLVGGRAWCDLVEIGGETCPTAPSP